MKKIFMSLFIVIGLFGLYGGGVGVDKSPKPTVQLNYDGTGW
ncbi:hypothetical protein [Bradyrhizobium japonicum]|nr:hypothetical protein [Bradyrhizobium japonicum]